MAAPPNILFVFIDDIGWGDLSCYGNSVKTKEGGPITPNLDRIASEGIRFTQGYVAGPICSPSRTGVLTGINPARYGIYSFLASRSENANRNMANWVQPEAVTSARLFQRAGYRTGQFGKWHMGNGRDVNDAPPPSAYGFDQSLVAFEGNGDRLLYYNDDGSKYGLSQQNEDASVGAYEYVYWYQAAGRQTDAALKFITNSVNAGKPFYVHVPYNDTHSPYNVPPGQENMFDHVTSDTQSRLFLGELHNLDKQIGRLVDGVDALGAGSNTLVVIIGDNGAPGGDTLGPLNRNGGLRGNKGNLFEGGIREPFIVRSPGLVPTGKVNSTTAISTLDLLPTYCSLAGISLPNAPFAGEDMSDVIRGSTRARVRPLFWEYGSISSVGVNFPKLVIRDGIYKFMRDPDGGRRQLYLIPQDHAESSNLVSQPAYAQIVARLEAQLMAWFEEVVLGNVGETYPCNTNSFLGVVTADNYDVAGGASPGTGFGEGSGVNYDLPSRLSGALFPGHGYRLGGTGGTLPRQPSDFSISDNKMVIAARNGNGRFEFSHDGTTPLDFGPYLAGRGYDITVKMNISTVGSSYAQRLSLSIADVSNAGTDAVDLGVQIGGYSSGLAVWKRLDGGSVSGGSDLNNRITEGLAINTPITLTLRVSDANANTTDYASTYQILVNGTVVNSGSFRFNTSTTARYIIFDVAAHEGPVSYDDFKIEVTRDSVITDTCRKPILNLSELCFTAPGQLQARLYWPVQAGMTVQPEISTGLSGWTPVTDGLGAPLSITTSHGSIQWLEVPLPAGAESAFFRIKR
jgi:arylsulfatase A-like enzyme